MSPIEASDSALGAWWGYAQADPTIVGVLVAAIVAFAIAHVVKRAVADHGPGRRTGMPPGPAGRTGSRGRD